MNKSTTYRDQICEAMEAGYTEVLISNSSIPIMNKWKALADIFDEMNFNHHIDCAVENPPRSSPGWVVIGCVKYRARKGRKGTKKEATC